MTSLVDELDEILGFQNRDDDYRWNHLRREDGELTVTVLERFGPEPATGHFGPKPETWESWDLPARSLRGADIDRLNKLIADIADENEIRTVYAINDDTGRAVAVPAFFWRRKPWVIHSLPTGGSIGETGAEWLCYEPRISDAKPRPRVAVPSETQKKANAWMRARAEDPRELDKNGKLKLTDDLKRKCMDAVGVTWRDAEVAHQALPEKYRYKGRPRLT
jgi:hypothetical protein